MKHATATFLQVKITGTAKLTSKYLPWDNNDTSLKMLMVEFVTIFSQVMFVFDDKIWKITRCCVNL